MLSKSPCSFLSMIELISINEILFVFVQNYDTRITILDRDSNFQRYCDTNDIAHRISISAELLF